MTMHYQESDPIILGSGELYIGLASEIKNPENLTVEEEEKLINIGAIESGAHINIATEKEGIKSANRGLIKKITTEKDIHFSTGVMTWVMENVAKFLTGSKYTETATEKKMVIGHDDESPVVYLRFIHEKADGGELIVNMYRGQFDGELEFVFDSEDPTTINYEFVSLATNNKNYIEFIETFPEKETEK